MDKAAICSSPGQNESSKQDVGRFRSGQGDKTGIPAAPPALCDRYRTSCGSEQIEGFKYGDLHEKLMLYADDMLLFLGDTSHSLIGVMAIIEQFGHFTGLTINWSKSALMMLDESRDVSLPDSCPIPITTSFKYLGVQISPNIGDYCSLTIFPLLSCFRDKINT